MAGSLSIRPISLARLLVFLIAEGAIVGYFLGSTLDLFTVKGKLYSDLVYPSLEILFFCEFQLTRFISGWYSLFRMFLFFGETFLATREVETWSTLISHTASESRHLLTGTTMRSPYDPMSSLSTNLRTPPTYFAPLSVTKLTMTSM